MMTLRNGQAFHIMEHPTQGILDIFPHRLYYGVVSSGFIYNLSFAVKNNSLNPIRVRLNCTPIGAEVNKIRLVHLPEKIAPGMSVTLILELTAEQPGTSLFRLEITQNFTEERFERIVEANVVNLETFKHVKKSLQLQKRPIYRSNVSVVGSVFNAEQQASVASSNFTESAMMDDDEVADILDMPLSSNVYWDPFNKMLRIDPQLCSVCSRFMYLFIVVRSMSLQT